MTQPEESATQGFLRLRATTFKRILGALWAFGLADMWAYHWAYHAPSIFSSHWIEPFQSLLLGSFQCPGLGFYAFNLSPRLRRRDLIRALLAIVVPQYAYALVEWVVRPLPLLDFGSGALGVGGTIVAGSAMATLIYLPTVLAMRSVVRENA